MKLKRKITKIGKEPENKSVKKSVKVEEETKKSKSSMPSDAYKEEIDPVEVLVDESRKIILSVKRGGDLGLLCADIRQFQTTQTYTGFTKKGINIPLEILPLVKAAIQDVIEECEDKGLFEAE